MITTLPEPTETVPASMSPFTNRERSPHLGAEAASLVMLPELSRHSGRPVVPSLPSRVGLPCQPIGRESPALAAPEQTNLACCVAVPYWEQVSASVGERIGFCMLAAGAVLGSIYGVACSVGLVGNWNLFRAGIERLLH